MKQSDGAAFMKNPMTYADKPWLKSYKLGPYKLEESLAPYPKVPVFKALDDAAEKYPGQTALLFLGRTIKFRDLKIQADRLAAALSKIGVKKGDKVCLFLPNCMEFVISDWAVLKAGAAVVPTSVLRTDEGLMHEVKSSGSKVIICQEEYLERILRIKEHGDIDRVIVTSKQGFDVADVSVTLPEGVHEFRKLLASHDPTPPQVDIDPTEDLCELAFTGGATGHSQRGYDHPLQPLLLPPARLALDYEASAEGDCWQILCLITHPPVSFLRALCGTSRSLFGYAHHLDARPQGHRDAGSIYP